MSCEFPLWKMDFVLSTSFEEDGGGAKYQPTISICYEVESTLDGKNVVDLGSVPQWEDCLVVDQLEFATMTSTDYSKPVYSVKFNQLGWSCQPGESFELYSGNDLHAITFLLKRLCLNSDAIIKVSFNDQKKVSSMPWLKEGCWYKVAEIFLKYLDLMHFPKKSLLKQLATFCQDQNEKRVLYFLSTRAGSPSYMDLARKHASFLDFLYSFPTCTPSLEFLLENLPALQPRLFSCCSSQGADHIEFIYNPIKFELPNGLSRLGLCSNWLERRRLREINEKMFVRSRTSNFSLPNHPDIKHIVLICSGTGISPFVGFLRTLLGKQDKQFKVWLFFGFRNRFNDFLFQSELLEYQVRGLIDCLFLCTSRDPESNLPRYVQHAINNHSQEIHGLLLREDVKFYICGSEMTMINGVFGVFCEILTSFSGLSPSQAQERLNGWLKENKIVRDIWI